MPVTESDTPTAPTPETISFQYDWNDDEPLSMRVVSAVAELTGCDPLALDRIYDRIDPDALEALFDPGPETSRTEGHVRFRYGGCEITVYGDGFTVVRFLV